LKKGQDPEFGITELEDQTGEEAPGFVGKNQGHVEQGKATKSLTI
jgi:hypothetical protein